MNAGARSRLAATLLALQVFAGNATVAATDGPTGVAKAPAGAGSEAAETPPLGRLFYSPERRAALDRRTATPRRAPVEAVAGGPSRLDGVVKRSSGRWTIWLDGRTLDENDAAGLASPSPTDAAAGRLAVGGEHPRRVEVKVGGRVDRASGRVAPLLDEGAIRVPGQPARR